MDASRLAASALAFSAMFVACSSGTGTTTGDAGATSDGATSSGDSGVTARVTFDSEIAPGTHSAAECPKTGTWFTIGSFGNPAVGELVRPVDDGGDDQGGKVTATCAVKPSGDGFDVSAHAQLAGPFAGAVTISGSFNAAGGQPNISLALTKGGETFSANDCVATFDPSVGEGIAAGRVWARIDCANATQAVAAQICKTSAQLRFENCAQ